MRGLHVLYRALLAAGAAASAWGHEGHGSLPVKGITIQGDRLTLNELARRSLGLAFAEVGIRTIEEWATGIAEAAVPPMRHAHVSSPLSGTVADAIVGPGDVVSPGTVLATVLSRELEELQAELLKAQAEHELAAGAAARLERLSPSGAAARVEMETARAEARRADQAFVGARRQLEALGLDTAAIDAVVRERAPVTALPLRSPIAGRVAKARAARGQAARAHAPLFEIVDASAVELLLRFPEERAPGIRPGQPVLFRPRAHIGTAREPVRAEVIRVEPVLGPVDGMLVAWARIAPGAGPLPAVGESGACEVRIGASSEAIAVPRSAVVEEGPERFVFVRESPEALVRKRVATGRSDRTHVEALDGVYPGDAVVAVGHQELSALFIRGTASMSAEARRNAGLALDETLVRPIETVFTVPAEARVPPARRAELAPALEGTVTAILKLPGDAVLAGETVLTARSPELERIQSALLQSLETLALSRMNLERVRTLGERAITARREVLEWEADERRAFAEAQGLRRQLGVAGLTEEEIVALERDGTRAPVLALRSPIAGTVAELRSIVGDGIGPERPAITVVDTSRIWIEGAAAEPVLARLGDVREARVRVHALPEARWPAVAPSGGPYHGHHDRRTPVRVELDNSDRAVTPGMRARLVLSAGGAAEALAVPVGSLIEEDGETFVFVEEKQAYRKRKVVPGRRDDRFAEVLPGSQVFPGDRVVSRGSHHVLTVYKGVK